MKKYLIIAVVALAFVSFAPKSASACSPTITVVSPNGGEVFTAGDTITVNWTSCGITSTYVDIAISFPPGWLPPGVSTTGTLVPNTGTASITLPISSQFIPSGYFHYGLYYKILIFDPANFAVQDLSDNVFTINALTAPIITTLPATSVTQTSAVLSGNVSSTWGDLVVRAIRYGTTTAYGGYIGVDSPYVPVVGLGNFSGTAGFLNCGTTYHYVAGMVDTYGRYIDGVDMTFTTLPCTPPPTVITVSATSFTTSAQLYGSFTDPGNTSSASIGFNYGATIAYGLTVSGWGASAGQSFDFTAGSLLCNTLYHYRAWTVTAHGNGYGTDKTFITLPCGKPIVTTDASVAFVYTPAPSITLNGTLIDAGGATDTVGFSYGPTTSYGSNQIASTAMSTPGSFQTTAVSRIACGATYHYAAFAYNMHTSVQGIDRTFMIPCPAVIFGTAFSSVTSSSIGIKSNLTSLGMWTGIITGFDWGTTTAYSGGPATYGSMTAPGPFSKTISGLASHTTYHLRAWVHDGLGNYVYGSDMILKTL